MLGPFIAYLCRTAAKHKASVELWSHLPEEYADAWDVVIDTAAVKTDTTAHAPGEPLSLVGRSVIVLREHIAAEPEPDHSVAASVAAQTGPERTATRSTGRSGERSRRR